jgi:glycosyltransferase involved in cell wall biosynthesis
VKVLHVVNNISFSSIPLELAGELGRDLDIVVLSFYDSPAQVAAKRLNLRAGLSIHGCGIRNIADVRGLIRFLRRIRRLAPDIIHTHHTLSGAVARICAKLIGRIKIVHTAHANHHSYSGFQNVIIGLTLPLCDSIVCNSVNTRNSFLKWQDAMLRQRRKTVVYNGVDIARVRASLNQPPTPGGWGDRFRKTDFIVGTVGRLVWPKDQATLIRGFGLFKAKVPAAKLLIVGDGKLRDELETLIAGLRLTEEVVITGMVPREDVYRLLRIIDVFVISSVFEGFCNAMVEAMIAAKPVIATAVDPLPEVLGETCGLFFEKRNPGDLAAALDRLYREPELRTSLGLAGQDRALKNFSLEASTSGYLDVYRRLCPKAM